MKSRQILIAVALVVLAGGWYLFRPEGLFIEKRVNESFPASPPAMAAAGMGNEAMPAPLASGSFHDVAHETRGTATIHRLAGGRSVLRLTGFHTSNGPDVHVYLVAASDASDNETVTRAGFLDLGSIKGSTGDQNYELPADLDLAKYRAVTVWCKRFGVNFGTAPLMAAAGGTAELTAVMAEPRPLAAGAFHDVAHETKGTATVYRLPDGRSVLRLTGFHTSNGPDVHVYLVAASDASDNETVTRAGFLDLGSIKGSTGDQNYELPADLDLAKYRAVTVWCKRFGVNFGTAPLMAAAGNSGQA